MRFLGFALIIAVGAIAEIFIDKALGTYNSDFVFLLHDAYNFSVGVVAGGVLWIK